MLYGQRIKLRAIDEADIPLIVQWRNERDVYDYFYEFEPLSIRHQKAWYEKQLGNSSEKNFIISLHDGTAVGMVSLVHIDPRNRKAEYGRLLVGDRDSKGAGYGVDAEILILNYAFDHLNLNRLYCEVLMSNESVIKLHKGLGFREEGIMKQFVFKNGSYQDVMLLAMLREDYDHEMAQGQLGQFARRLI